MGTFSGIRPVPAPSERRREEPRRAEDRGIATVRVQAERLDELMDRVGELVIAQARLSQLASAGSDLSIKVEDRVSPPTALASFTGRFQLKLLRGSIPYEQMVRRFRIKLIKEGDRWLIVGVEESNPTQR